MFPLYDDNPTLRVPLLVMAVIAINAAAWILLQGMGAEPDLSSSLCAYGLVPGEVLGLVPAGTQVVLGPRTSCVLGGQISSWFTPVTSMFMHGSWFHIIGNMWFLWVFGNNVEDSMGRLRFVVFYLLCGLAAAAVQTASAPASSLPMVGASGAIGGVMGAYAILYPRARVYSLLFLGFFVRMIAVPAWFMLGYWFLLQILGGLPTLGARSGGVAFWAHVGGFLAGAVLIFPFRNPRFVAAHRRARRF